MTERPAEPAPRDRDPAGADETTGARVPVATGADGQVPQPIAETLQRFSHDIRSAMSDVIGGLRLVDRARLDPEAQTQIDRVQAAGETLAMLVDAALMAAAGETMVQDESTEIEMRAWLSALIGRWSGRARAAGTSFTVDVSGRLPERVQVPRMALDRILANLIGNALKQAGPVTLRLSMAPDGGLRLTVRDAGAGFPDEILARFARGEAPGAMGAQGGSGLGLKIARDLTEQIGGTLGLRNRSAAVEGGKRDAGGDEAEVGAGGQNGGGNVAGAEAVLHLPACVLDWQPDDPGAGAEPDLSGLRILVAEDNLTNQMILRQILGRMQADAVFVSDGIAALERLERDAFDLALVDIEMPRASGLEVMQAVRARGDAVAGLPMIALTAYVLRDNREAIYAAGADGILGKPIASVPEFGRAILRHAGRPAGLPEPEDVLAASGDDTGLGPQLDEARFAGLMAVAGPDGRAELLQRLHADLMSVRDALSVAIRAGDLAEIRAQTHILIAVAGAVGAERLSRLAEVLNIAAKRRRNDDLEALYAPCEADLGELLARVEREAQARGVPPG